MRQIIATVLLGSMLGCTTFGPVNPKEFVMASRPQQVWVYKADSSVVLVRGPHFLPSGDTLVGLVDGEYKEMPLSDITQVKASRPAPLQTAALVVGGVGVVVGAAVLLKKGSGDSNQCNGTTCDVSNILP